MLNTKNITDLSGVSIEEKKHSIPRAPILVEGDVATDIEEVRSFLRIIGLSCFQRDIFFFSKRILKETLLPHIFFPSYTFKIALIMKFYSIKSLIYNA